MRLSLDTSNGYQINGYGDGLVVVNQTPVRRSVVITPERLSDWPPARFEDLAPGHFQQLLSLDPELVLFGSGARQRFPAPALTRPLAEANIGMEVMDTAAACRTYNIVMAEGRRVVAALLVHADSD